MADPTSLPDRRTLLAASAAAGVVGLLPLDAFAAGNTTQKEPSMTAVQGVKPFHVKFPQEALVYLKKRVAAARWPDKEQVPDTTQGVQLATMQQVAQHWANHDWRKV